MSDKNDAQSNINPPRFAPLDMRPLCGNCAFGHGVDIGVVECRGMPPQLILMPDARGNASLQLARPNLPSSTPGCALHRMRMNGESERVN